MAGVLTARRAFAIHRFLAPAIACLIAGCAAEPVLPPEAGNEVAAPGDYLEQRIARYRRDEISPSELHVQQTQSVDYALYSPVSADHPGLVPLPAADEIEEFLTLRREFPSEAFDYLDGLFALRDDLKALAVRDSDGDGIPDYMISDYFGKFMEGDVDIDGDGVRNTLDARPYDASSGGGPASAADGNDNGVPDHVDLALRGRPKAVAAIQSTLLRDHGILLVERNAAFDMRLALAVDDAVRRVFRAYFEKSPVMPTLRTLAVEHTALINPAAKQYVEDYTGAQAFSQTQSLTVYDEGRAVDHDIGLLGLLVHEIGHGYHMALDFDAGDPAGENARTDFPAPNFARIVEPFGWTVAGYHDGALGGSAPVLPRFAYIGTSEPEFKYRERSTQAWSEWLAAQYEALGEDPEYLKAPVFADRHVIGDYALSSPYEWFGDHMIAYVVTVLEQHALTEIEAAGRGDAVEPARDAIESALRAIWPDFYHRNIAPDVFAWFERTFPITSADREILVRRYIDPVLDSAPES